MSTYFYYVCFICYSILRFLAGAFCRHEISVQRSHSHTAEQWNRTEKKSDRKQNGYKAHTCFNFPRLQNASILCIAFLLCRSRSQLHYIQLMHVYTTLFCVCIWAQNIEIQNERTKNENNENGNKKRMGRAQQRKGEKQKKCEQRRKPGPWHQSTAILRPIHILCVLVDYKTFLVKTCLHPHVEHWICFVIIFFLAASLLLSFSYDAIERSEEKKFAFIFLLMRWEHIFNNARTTDRYQIIRMCICTHKRFRRRAEREKIHSVTVVCTALLHATHPLFAHIHVRLSLYVHERKHSQRKRKEKKIWSKCVNVNRKLGEAVMTEYWLLRVEIKLHSNSRPNMHHKIKHAYFSISFFRSRVCLPNTEKNERIIARGELKLQEITNYVEDGVYAWKLQTLCHVFHSKRGIKMKRIRCWFFIRWL